MTKGISAGSGVGMDRKVSARQQLIIRCQRQILNLLGRSSPSQECRSLLADLKNFITNQPKVRPVDLPPCDPHAIWLRATAHWTENRGQMIERAIAAGTPVPVPAGDLAAMRDRIEILTNMIRHVDREFADDLKRADEAGRRA